MKKSIFVIFAIAIIILLFSNFNKKQSIKENNLVSSNYEKTIQNETIEDISENTIEDESILVSSQVTIELKDLDGKEKNYSFLYKGESFNATFSNGAWHIKNSYKIKDKKDITLICQALIDVHPVHGNDGVSYRNAEDMAYEWLQHNLAYEILPEDNAWRNNAKDVDLDPKDQYKSLKEIYEDRTGKKLF